MVLTESQKEIQRKRKISQAVSKEQADIGTQKRKQIDAEDRARIAGAPESVVQRDIRAPETVEEKAVVEQIGQEEFRQEDVTKIQTEVGAEREQLPESVIQESERARVERDAAFKERQITDAVGLGATREEAELQFAARDPEMQNILKQSTGGKLLARTRDLFGDVGRDFLGLSLNQVLDNISGDVTQLSALTGQMSEAASLLPAIEGAVNNGAINPFRALAELDSAERDGEILRGDMDRLAVLRPETVQTKEYLEMRVELDVYLADIRDARGTALEKLRTTETEFNILETQSFIEDIRKRNEKK